MRARREVNRGKNLKMFNSILYSPSATTPVKRVLYGLGSQSSLTGPVQTLPLWRVPMKKNIALLRSGFPDKSTPSIVYLTAARETRPLETRYPDKGDWYARN
jgi:hypothetical protein